MDRQQMDMNTLMHFSQMDRYADLIKSNYTNVQTYRTGGTFDGNLTINHIWKVTKNEIEFILVYCDNNTLAKINIESFEKLIDIEKKRNDIIYWQNKDGIIIGTCGNHLITNETHYIDVKIFNEI